jgi:hypothetical protein
MTGKMAERTNRLYNKYFTKKTKINHDWQDGRAVKAHGSGPCSERIVGSNPTLVMLYFCYFRVNSL